MNKQAFIDRVSPVAVKLRRQGSPIFPSIRIAQALLETGGVIHEWNNLVGFKAGKLKPNKYWDGRTVGTGTWEVYDGKEVTTRASWRVYSTIEDCFRDQDLLFEFKRYAQVCAAPTPEDQAVALYRCGYATDPAYHQKIIAIARGLKQYDVPPYEEAAQVNIKEDEDKLELSKYQRDRLVLGLQNLLEQKVINDKAWLEKAQKGTLTLSELAWLNFELTVNK